jgi:diguanylate cyclase (GGDEF)-like protein
MLLIGCINYLAGAEISVSILYLLPVSLVSWFVGRKEGSLLALGSSLSWYVAEMSFGRSYSHPLLHCWNLAVMFSFFIIINFTLAAFRKALDREKEFARVDALTGVTNGRQFQEMVEREVERSRRYGHPLTLLYLDCDNFKNVNDKFGHQIGNRCLKFLAAILQENVRNIDMVARLGGDEFVILMPETGEQFVPQGAQRLHARLVSALRDMGWPVTLSMGAAVYLDPPASAEELIKSADHLMLQSKNGGKNRVQYQVFGAPRPSEEAAPETRKSFSPATLPRPFQARFALHALQAADSFLNRAHSRIPGRRAAQEN